MARLKTQFEFMAGIYFDDEIYFNKYSMMIDFYTVSGTIQDQNIAADRLSYLIYEVVSRSIFISETAEKKISALTNAGLTVLTVPEPGPIDPIVLAVLVTKMNAILEGILIITEAEILSDISSPITYVWDEADSDDDVHTIVNDSDETRWWTSIDPRFGSYPADIVVADVEKTQPFPLTWDMLDLDWYDPDAVEIDTVEYSVDIATPIKGKTPGKTPGTVIRADFNPKKK